MKIAIITSGYYPVIDGVTVSIHNRLKQLSNRGHQVLLVCPTYTDVAVYTDQEKHSGNIMPGVFVCNVPSSGFMGLDFERNVNFAANKIIDAALANFLPNVIHVDEPERLWMGLFKRAGIGYARKSRIPCVAAYHTNFIDYADDFIKAPAFVMRAIKFAFRQLLKHVYNAYDTTIVPGSETRDKIIRLGVRNVKSENINGVDYGLFSSSASNGTDFFREKYNLDGLMNRIKLIFIGRLTDDKNWRFTMSVLPKLARRLDYARIAVFIVGDGPMRSEIQTRLCGVLDDVHLLGRISQQELSVLLRNCDIHVSASKKETRSLTLIEAMAAGVPVLAPRAGGFAEDIVSGYNGYLFEPDNEDDFVEKCSLVIGDKDLRMKMARNAQNYAEQFAWEFCVDRLLKVWSDTLAAHNGKSMASTKK